MVRHRWNALSGAKRLPLIITLSLVGLAIAGCQQAPSPEEERRECVREHPESVSCGWPVYLPDGTRIDKT